MTDQHTPERRSWNMARIRAKGNASTEMRLVYLFRENGINGWRRHLSVVGRPDFTFPRKRLVIFVDGCFWHGCPKCKWIPTTNASYWVRKFERNKTRDKEVNRLLRRSGWRVIRVWEHSLKKTPGRAIARIKLALENHLAGFPASFRASRYRTTTARPVAAPFGRTVIATRWPSAVKNRNSRSRL